MSSSKNKSFILSCVGVSKEFDETVLFKDVSFSISAGEKIGLVGPNGAGKSTLLKIILGETKQSSGIVTKPPGVDIKYLPQVHHNESPLSGGEAAKKVLEPILASDADLFLLDEPSNNLDLEGLKTVEEFILNSTKSFIIISHDRALLDKTVSKIIELDPVEKTIHTHSGNYSSYVKEREARTERQWKNYSDKVEKTKKIKGSLTERLGWMKEIEAKRLGVKKLSKNEKEKPQAAVLRDQEAAAGRRARIMKDKLSRFEKESSGLQKPEHLLPLHITFDHERGSTNVFELTNIKKVFPKKTIGPLSASIHYGDRVHIVGSNGSGKTTLLKVMLGILKPDDGTVTRGANVMLGYVPQERWVAHGNESVLEEFMSTTKIDEADSRKILNRFRITAEDVHKNISLLSPGEYSRLVIAEIAALHPNCIVLDEPSNHLDLEVLEELERGLIEYTGTLIVISHDRYMVEKLNLHTTITLE